MEIHSKETQSLPQTELFKQRKELPEIPILTNLKFMSTTTSKVLKPMSTFLVRFRRSRVSKLISQNIRSGIYRAIRGRDTGHWSGGRQSQIQPDDRQNKIRKNFRQIAG